MILEALTKLAVGDKLIEDPDFEFRPVSWRVTLRDDGTVIAVEDYRFNENQGKTDRRGRELRPNLIGRKTAIPVFPTGRAGIAPKAAFLVDMAKFVFGVEPQAETAKAGLAEYVKRFREQVVDCEAATADPAVTAVRRMLDRVLAGEPVTTLPAEAGPSDLFMFRLGDGEPVHDRPSVRAYWKQRRAAPAATDDRAAAKFTCIVTGTEIVGEPPLFPLIKNVPGAGTMGSALLAFNGPSSRTWSSRGLRGNENAAVSRPAAEAAAKALNRLADPRPTNGKGEPLPVRRIKLSDDTIVVFWSSSPDPEIQSALDRLPLLVETAEEPTTQSETDVANLLVSPRTGRFTPLNLPAQFYAMTVTGTTGRIVIKDWFEFSVQDLQRHLAAYFADLLLLDYNGRPPNGKPIPISVPPPGLANIKAAILYDPRKGKLPAGLAADLWRVAVTPGRPLPARVVAQTLERIRASLGKGDPIAPAAFPLLKLAAIRNGDKHMSATINKLHPNPAYHCGRLMAAIAEAQRWARKGVKTDATVTRRFFGAAMTAPAAYFGRLLAMTEKAHLPKIAGKRQRYLRATICDILRSVPNDLPRTLTLQAQSTFTLGFNHQEAEFHGLPDLKFLNPTKRGPWVGSAGERVVADALTNLGHDWWYETTVNTDRVIDGKKERRYRVPDFLLPAAASKDDRFIEVLGMMDLEDYRRTWASKLDEYRAEGVLPFHEAEHGDNARNGRLYWINTSKQDCRDLNAPTFMDAGGKLDELKIQKQLAAWFGDKTGTVGAGQAKQP